MAFGPWAREAGGSIVFLAVETGASLLAEKYGFVFVGLIASAGLAVLVWGWWAELERVGMTPAMLVIVVSLLGLCAGLFWQFHSFGSPFALFGKTQPAYSWTWDKLSESQISILADGLKSPAKVGVIIISVTPASREFANSLGRVFDRAGWGKSLRQGALFDAVAEGVSITPQNASSAAIQKTFKEILNQEVHYMAARPDAGPFEGGMTTILIGAKPMPDPLPVNILADMSSSGAESLTLGRDISAFSREREKNKALLPSLENVPPENRGLMRFSRDSNYSSETESLFRERFADRAAVLLAKFGIFGIVMPKQVQWSGSKPSVIGEWFRNVGDYLSKGDLKSARQIGGDPDFWFRRL